MIKKKKLFSLRSFISITVSLIVTTILLFSTVFYYIRTSAILTDHYRQSITGQVSQVTQQFVEQIDSIDSIIPLFLSNTLILDALEAESASPSPSNPDNQFYIEKQMSNIYYSTTLSNKNFTNCIFIISNNQTIYSTYTSGSLEPITDQSRKLLDKIDKSETRLMCERLSADDPNLYFIRNLFSGNTGKYMGTFVLNISKDKWMDYCIKGMDPVWFTCLFNKEINLVSNPEMMDKSAQLQQMDAFKNRTSASFQELALDGDDYFVAAQNLSNMGLTLAACAPKDLLFNELHANLQAYLIILACTLLAALLAAIVISRAITRPVEKMIYHINQISTGEQAGLPPMRMYYEFQVWAESFNKMLEKLDVYYNDNFQKQLLLKNSEIRALQSQMDPHFMFNVLNTIAWKAEMSDNEEIYQMVISLGELLKANTLSKERDFIRLEQEMEYVKFYIYLQQMRFEDKISCSIQIPDSLLSSQIPCFCIQPLIENAIIHGLEPKRGKGQLIIFITRTDTHMEVSIIDNGVGFQKIPDIRSIRSSDEDSHTHIGLRNLDKRLELLFGEGSRLKIDSVPNKCTSISFKIPIREE